VRARDAGAGTLCPRAAGELDGKLKAAAEAYDFNTYTRALVDFCNEDLGLLLRYPQGLPLLRRAPDRPRATPIAPCSTLFHALVRYAAPVLVFTAEEVWLSRYPEMARQRARPEMAVHLLEWPSVPIVVVDTAKWAQLRALRDAVNEAIEPLRRDKTIRSSLEAEVTFPPAWCPKASATRARRAVHHRDSHPRAGRRRDRHQDHPPQMRRCWRHLPDVAEDGALVRALRRCRRRDGRGMSA
jgi:isoleucyl-tRNA synthetase